MKKNTALTNPQLEAFMAVAEHKTVHAGARAIHISQTAMTQRILQLERRLGSTLFIRTPYGMKLTPEGEKLLRYCRTVTDYGAETLADIRDAGLENIQRIKISGPSSIMSSRIIPSCMSIMREFPMLYLSFNVNDTDDVVHSLRTGISHFAILRPEQVTRDMTVKKLSPDKFLLVACRDWRRRKLINILQHERIIDFDESDQTTLNYLKQFHLSEYAQPDRLFVNRNDSLMQMFVAGFGYGVLTKEFSQPYLKSGELVALNSGKSYDRQMFLAWYDRPEPPRYFEAIIDGVR